MDEQHPRGRRRDEWLPFLRCDLIDELSLLLTPVADGGEGEPALFDVEEGKPAKAIAKLPLKSVRRAASGMLWIKYAVQNRSMKETAARDSYLEWSDTLHSLSCSTFATSFIPPSERHKAMRLSTA